MVQNPDINNIIWMYRHYKAQAKRCFDIYKNIEEAYYMYDFYMEFADVYERAILSHI